MFPIIPIIPIIVLPIIPIIRVGVLRSQTTGARKPEQVGFYRVDGVPAQPAGCRRSRSQFEIGKLSTIE